MIKDAANRYFLSLVMDVDPVQVDAANQSIGLELGIKTFAVMSNGEKAVSLDYSKQDRKIRKFQKKLARQQKGPWEPTSQVCSDCGCRWGKLDL